MHNKDLRNMNQRTAKIIIDGNEKNSYEFPILHGVEGSDALDITTFLQKTGMLMYDPGFMSTASCHSQITYIDGDKGRLEYRGYPIDELADNASFLEVCYLLLYGELPKKAELKEFENSISNHTLVDEQLKCLFNGFKRDSHPMAIMVGSVGCLSAFYHENLDVRDTLQREMAAIRLIAKVPTLASMAHKYSIGQPFIYPQNSLDYSSNFLRMMFAVPSYEYEVNPVHAKALNKLLILHADHEQNASTSTVRLTGSSGANPFAAIAAGIASLWGPAHGGANEAVIRMLEEIGHPDRVGIFVDKAKNKDDPFRLMGFGHRVYKSYDPRATVLKETCREVLKSLKKKNDPLMEIAMKLEEIALKDEYFIERKLYPNVDFYSGIIYRALQIPTKMFTVMFAVARTAGWIAQWKEMMEDPNQKIGRPRQLYTGNSTRKFIPLEKR